MTLDPNIQEFITRLAKDEKFQNQVEEYTEEHLSIRRKRINDWNENNREKLKTSQKEYAQSEPGKIAAKRRIFKRRTLEKQAFDALSPHEKKKMKQFYEDCPDGLHVDHIIPLVKGGEHKISNLQYLLPLENAKKAHKTKEKLSKIEIEYPVELSYFDEPPKKKKSLQNLKYQSGSKLENFSNSNKQPSSHKEILAAVYRDRYKHPITQAYLMRKYKLSYENAIKVKSRIDAYDAKNPVWYPGKPVEQNQESLNDFIKRITPKRK